MGKRKVSTSQSQIHNPQFQSTYKYVRTMICLKLGAVLISIFYEGDRGGIIVANQILNCQINVFVMH